MNIFEFDVLKKIYNKGYTSQRRIADATGYSLGKVNSSIKKLTKAGYLDYKSSLTQEALKEFEDKKPKNAIILAAGFGLRMLPINKEVPKGLIKIQGEPLIERLIKQLHEVSIYDIDIVVGFLKEKYEYLIGKYGVNLVYNPDYSNKNNIHSLNMLVDKIANTYVMPCDVWVDHNPFSKEELYSWYCVSDRLDEESTVRISRSMKLVDVEEGKQGNAMIGISYLLEEEALSIGSTIKKYCRMKKYNRSFWEDALFDGDHDTTIYARVYKDEDYYEINTYEQLRALDEESEDLDSSILSVAAEELGVDISKIRDVTLIKRGMTNRSFWFNCNDQQYVMRIPGEASDKIINRKNEYEIYETIKGQGISDEVIYLSPKTGYKISRYWKDAKTCDPLDPEDVKECMDHLRRFHEIDIKVSREIDLFERIKFYESLWEGKPSIFIDYDETKNNILSLKEFIEDLPKKWTLAHIDGGYDNYLFVDGEVKLIDWEYGGMQDGHVDIAMFAIFAMYDRDQVDRLIDSYFPEGCTSKVRIKIYAYIAIGGLLWSNWCEFKRYCGVEFGEYSLKQYHYAKKYYNIVKKEIEKEIEKEVEKEIEKGK